MKKFLIYVFMVIVAGCMASCNNDEDIDTANSIFIDSQYEPTGFDKWLLSNYVHPYNIQVKYRLDDTETDVKYDLVPANYDNAVALMKIVKHVWIEAYDELWGIENTRTYVPRLIQLIGNVAYTESGMILGQAEGGLKVMLFRVNELDFSDPEKVNVAILNEYYFKTMHHEFAHILNQTKPYDPSYERITESDYVGSTWNHTSVTDALKKGFISNYAMDRASEDFAEMISIYVTNTAADWEYRLSLAGADGRAKLDKKLEIVYNYMRDSWGVDMNDLRNIVQRRQNEISKLDLSTIK